MKLHSLPWKVFWCLVAVEVVLAGMHVLVTWAPAGTCIRPTLAMFDLGQEGNLPTWFSAAQFLLLGLVLGAIYLLERRRHPEKPLILCWLALALGALFLSADEAAQIHEWIGAQLSHTIEHANPRSWVARLILFPSYYWVLIYAPIGLPLAAVVARFLWRQLGPARGPSTAGILLFLAGAVGLDYAEGRYRSGPSPFLWHMDVFLVEEMAEMLGVTLVLTACLVHTVRLLDPAGGSGDLSRAAIPADP
ncbi:MAG: hypothetical protein HY319_07190 [Armatimonadetes bacterium]|nr:hypothetical protein [Armatimonadota bacterium]